MQGSKTKLKFYKDKLSGHRDTIVNIYSPQGPKGGILVSVSRDGRLKVWDLIERGYIIKRILTKAAHAAEDIGQKVEFGPMDAIESALFSEKTIYCGYCDGAIYGWNMKEGTLIYNFEGHDDAVTGLAWLTPDRFVSCSYDQTIIFWDVLVAADYRRPESAPAFSSWTTKSTRCTSSRTSSTC
jgi:WD40 repeat protein